MRYDPNFWTNALGLWDTGGGFLLLWSWVRITTAAGFTTATARWALCRRFFYTMGCISLFGLGLGRLNGNYIVDPIEAMFSFMLSSVVIVFPFLRAIGWISQDQFVMVGDMGSHHRS